MNFRKHIGKQFALLFGVLFLLQSFAYAQWPPGGVTPSASLKHFHLPSKRFVPSTKRWNLVWADQIIPGNFSDAQIKFAAQHYAATQKIFSDQAAQFRAINPSFLVTIYHLAAGLNPLHDDDCPLPRSSTGSGFIGDITPKGYISEFAEYFIPWLATHGIKPADSMRELMFQHYDQNDSLHRVWHQDPAWLMNISDTNWQKYCGDICLDWMQGNLGDGCFFDVAVETNSSLYNPQASDSAPHNFDWWLAPHGPATNRTSFSTWQNQSYLSCYQKIYKRFHTDTLDYLVIPNTDQMVTTVYDPVWTDGDANGETIDGAMMEGFGDWTGFDMWQTLERGLRHITSRGKILIAQFYNVDSVERLRRVAMYMLIKNENSFLNIINGNGVEWYPEYEIDLGEQSPLPKSLDSLRFSGTSWQSLWMRSYSRGRVVCNTNSVDMQIPIDEWFGKWAQVITSGGGSVNSDGTKKPQSISYVPVSGPVTIPASGGAIFIRADSIADVNYTTNPNRERLEIYPNPAHNLSTIHFSNTERTPATISILNILGSNIATIFNGELEAGEHSFTWEAGHAADGLYTCIVSTRSGIEHSVIILQK